MDIPAKQVLTEIYSAEGATLSSIAKQFGVSQPTVRRWMIVHQIDRKSHQQASCQANNRHRIQVAPNRQVLAELYDQSSIDQLEQHFAVGQQTIYQWLSGYQIPLKSHDVACSVGKQKQFANIRYDKQTIIDAYDRTKPLAVLADTLNISHSYLRKLLVEHEIQPSRAKTSVGEQRLLDHCRTRYPDRAWLNGDREIISPKELDIVNVTDQIAIEYCGVVWHSETFGGKSRKYHQQKYIDAVAVGYKLITVFDTDPINKVNNLLDTLHRKKQTIFARTTTVEKISAAAAREFVDRHHLAGFSGGANHYALVDRTGQIVHVATFGKSRFSTKFEYECVRSCSDGDYTIVGGVSKIFEAFRRDVKPSSCVSYADLRFGRGSSYRHCQFDNIGITQPNYWYFNRSSPNKLYSRIQFQKHKQSAVLDQFDRTLSEYQNMLNNGWDRIWDCGNNVWGRKY